MAYRNPDPVPADAMAASALRDVAALGRLRREASAAREARAQARARAREQRKQAKQRAATERSQAHRRAMSLVTGSWITEPVLSAWLLSIVAGAMPLAVFAGSTVAVAIAVLAALPALAIVPRAIAARRNLAREQAWLGSHPFAIDGHVHALGTDARSRELRVVFADRRPPADLVADLLAAAELDGLTGDEDAIAIRVPGASALFEHNHRYRRVMHALVDRVLMPLHAVYPVRAVRVIDD